MTLANSRRCRERAISLALRFECGMFWSDTARALFRAHYGIEIGSYSYGECFVPGAFPAGTVVGRYVSIAAGVRVFTRNHPMERLSLHPFFYNHLLGLVHEDTIESGRLVIEHDAWIGERAIVTPGCTRIGVGAVVGAGAVVTKNVDDFAIVAGNPARVIRRRFDDATSTRLMASRWWMRPAHELRDHLADLLKPVVSLSTDHPLLHPRS